MWKKLLLVMILLMPEVSSATIYGNVYDYSLNLIKDAKIEIDTTPQQVIVSKEGSYSFSAPNGDYAIAASKDGIGITERITVIDDGSYIVDLILVESVEDDTGLLQDEDISIDSTEARPINYLASSIIILVAIILLAGIAYMVKRFIKARNYDEDKEMIKESKEKSVDGGLEKLVELIKKEGGRVTQKDIRKRLGLSEAKISLMVAELESKGIVKKIKKGRGNIIILS